MIWSKRLPSLLLLSGLLTACSASSPSAPSPVVKIRATTSFGLCVGYCRTTLEITSQEAVFLRESQNSTLPDQRSTAPVSAADWAALVQAVDRRHLEALPEVIGCPDCADGGAESLQVVGADWQRSVTFEYGRDIPELQPLLNRVRSIRGSFTP